MKVAGDGQSEALFSPGVSKEISAVFLQQLADTDPQADHVVIWDQAGFHHKQNDPDIPLGIHILSLPPYSPELNPVETIGDLIKDAVGNPIFETLEQIQLAIQEELKPIWQSPHRVRSLIGPRLAFFFKQTIFI